MQQPIFQHKDFYLASLLVYNKFELISHKREKGSTIFTFVDSNELQKVVSDYFGMKAIVNDFLSMSGVIRNLKTIIHSNRYAQSDLSNYQQGQLNNGTNHSKCGSK